jgi:enamine deaminase RidA (YjgF/YER057c/UK114 family)
MDNISAMLAAHGGSLTDVVNIRTYLTDMSQLSDYGKVRAERLSSTPPTITTVEVSRLWVPGALLEVEVLAIILGAGSRSAIPEVRGGLRACSGCD